MVVAAAAAAAVAGGGRGAAAAPSALRGRRGTLVSVDQEAYRARVRMDGEQEDRSFDYEEICKLV